MTERQSSVELGELALSEVSAAGSYVVFREREAREDEASAGSRQPRVKEDVGGDSIWILREEMNHK